ncbi:SGNH/GDSL hydrolase family protein [Calothrix sp. 336/3]|uniref:SGNH/GDSL hydrolase family protein n=1 Tax=Calothrix sp. 336/3 TaxID=1337936 RepID=UPI0004E457AD|nr:SGNH/GDSL hydrolase family protein [Calothrix sp. 336/3]AKG23760.1 hypothetical protein IJ00_22905 [Calothrix sp. 336/3]
MAHIILLGDSIFDNANYVADGLPIIEQVRQGLVDSGDRADLLAVDGDSIQDIFQQLHRLPPSTTHLFISIGGNDALCYGAILQNSTPSLPAALQQIATMKTEFSRNYQQMLRAVLKLGLPTTVCTIYDQCPVLDPALRLLEFTALSMFNDCITRQAVEFGLPLIDLRVVCDEARDYSSLSPIEPSTVGGEKIARCIVQVVTEHNFSSHRTICYT